MGHEGQVLPMRMKAYVKNNMHMEALGECSHMNKPEASDVQSEQIQAGQLPCGTIVPLQEVFDKDSGECRYGRTINVASPRIAVQGNGTLEVFDPGLVIRVEGSRNYSVFHLKDRKAITVTKNLKAVESLCAISGFIRIHKSHIINIYAIQRIRKQEGRRVQMMDEYWVPVSEQGWASLRPWLDQWQL